jgi:hypothetical protein
MAYVWERRMQSFVRGYRRKGIVHCRRREDNIKIDFKELGWEGVYWILYFMELLDWLTFKNLASHI